MFGTEDALTAVVANDQPEVLGPATPERVTGVGVGGSADAVGARVVGRVVASGSAHDVTPRRCFRR